MDPKIENNLNDRKEEEIRINLFISSNSSRDKCQESGKELFSRAGIGGRRTFFFPFNIFTKEGDTKKAKGNDDEHKL